jgi:hypothetical protein
MALNRVNAGNRGLGNASNAGVGVHSKRIQAGLSTQIVIQVEEGGQKYVVGAIQSIRINQTRPLGETVEVGTDGIISIQPTAATKFSAELTRVVFDFQRLPQALQREYRNINAQRRPFDIVITDYNPYIGTNGVPTGGDTESSGGGGGTEVSDEGAVTTDANSIETVLKNCWFGNLNISFEASNYIITETASLQFEHMYDTVAPNTLAGDRDRLERLSGTSNSASVMSAFDGTRNP